MKNIGVITSGGDAPGMNAAIRAVVRIAGLKQYNILGFERGWEGLIMNNFQQLSPRSVSGIVEMGGTILHTSRCPEFETREGLEKGARHVESNRLEGLIVIGGEGSFKGALELSRITDVPIAGIPATIDNDVYGTDETIGFDTAVNTAVSEIDKIRDTATSHERLFVVEVMGRKRGFIAAMVGLTTGAEIILVPEVGFKIENIFKMIEENTAKGKRSGIIVAAEGIGDTRKLAGQIERNTGTETRLSILGYAQRGGSPTARSRYLASIFGNRAIEILTGGKGNKIAAIQDGKVVSFDLEESTGNKKPLDTGILTLAGTLAK